MFATYLLNIRRLLTLSIRRRPNLYVKSEHRRIIAKYSLAVRENYLRTGNLCFSRGVPGPLPPLDQCMQYFAVTKVRYD